MPTDDWERGYSAGWRAARRDDVRDITRDMGESKPKTRRKRRKGKPMTRKTQLAINRGRKAKGLKPIKFKKKGR